MEEIRKFYLLDISRSHLNFYQNYAIVLLTEEQLENLPYHDDSVVEYVTESNKEQDFYDFETELIDVHGYPSNELISLEAKDIFS